MLHVPMLKNNLFAQLYLKKHKHFEIHINSKQMDFQCGSSTLFCALVHSDNCAYQLNHFLSLMSLPTEEYVTSIPVRFWLILGEITGICGIWSTLFWHRLPFFTSSPISVRFWSDSGYFTQNYQNLWNPVDFFNQNQLVLKSPVQSDLLPIFGKTKTKTGL